MTFLKMICFIEHDVRRVTPRWRRKSGYFCRNVKLLKLVLNKELAMLLYAIIIIIIIIFIIE